MTFCPKISVLLPVYNAKRYLKEAIESVLTQTYDNFELIIIDDGSVDNSMNIASEFDDKRIRLFHKNHQGLIEALNFGLERAEGRWIARMDADDIALPDRFKVQQEYLSNHEDVVAVGGAAYIIDANGKKTGQLATPPYNHNELLNAVINMNKPSLIHPAVMIKTESVRALNGYRKEFPACEDVDLWLRLASRGNLCSLQEPVLLLRKHGENISVKKNHISTRSHLAAIICYFIYQKTGIDYPAEYPESWQSLIDEIDYMMQVRGIDTTKAFYNNVVQRIKKRKIIQAIVYFLCNFRFKMTKQLLFRKDYREIVDQITDKTISALKTVS